MVRKDLSNALWVNLMPQHKLPELGVLGGVEKRWCVSDRGVREEYGVRGDDGVRGERGVRGDDGVWQLMACGDSMCTRSCRRSRGSWWERATYDDIWEVVAKVDVGHRWV